MAGNTRPHHPLGVFLWTVLVAVCAFIFATQTAVAQFPTLPSRPAEQTQPKTPPSDKKPATAPRGGEPQLWEEGDEVVPPKPLPKGSEGAKTEEELRRREQAPAQLAADGDGPMWSVLLVTVSGDEHQKTAIAARDRIVARFPQLSDAFVRRVGQGSAVLVGKFGEPGDAAAQSRLRAVKALEADGRRAFPLAMLTRTSTDVRPPGPYDVRRLRERFPNVHPLYSLQVAAWSTFGDKALSREEIRNSAEKYCRELRAKGFEAWVHHDDSTGTSVVTVGHFDHTAYDSKSTLFAPEVEALMKKFPRHLVNGGEVLVAVDPREDPSKPGVKTRPQGCRLVEIPK
jgi:hypothetical protein